MTDDATPLSERVAQLAQGGCTALSATPTMWRKILMTPAACRLELKQVTLGGEIVPQQVLDALRAQYPTARLTHIYASTEAGVGFAVKDGKEGFPASLVENPPQGLSIRISAAGHLLLRSDCDDQTYADTARHLRDEDGFIDTGDVVLHQGDRFRFQGRADGRINVGGNKVYPEEVERVLSTFPGVAMVVVGSIQSSLVGELVEAKVVVASPLADASEFRRQLLQHCRNHLAPFKVPAIVNFVDSLSINSNGKVLRASRSEESKS